MQFPQAFTGSSDNVNVIIETPKGSRNKFAFDSATGLFKLKKTLPAGMTFPFDFGFIPNTRGEDGDPVDALVLMDEPAHPGCWLECRVIGVIEVEQKEDNGEVVRNDRIVTISLQSFAYSSVATITDLDKKIIDDMVTFL